MSSRPLKLFYSYSHRDEELRDQLETHLSMLKREGVIDNWHDRKIQPGKGWDGQIDEHLNTSDIILLLLSADFLASDYCSGVDVSRAMERHERGEARLIPVILRPCDWQSAPFGKLQALPRDAKPVTLWTDRDSAFFDIAWGIQNVSQEFAVDRNTGFIPTASLPRPPAVGFVPRRDSQGRDIVERLKEELTTGDQLIVLSGPGGVGKTTLATETARALSQSFAGRIVWIGADGREAFALSTLLDEAASQLGREDLRSLGPDQKAGAVAALLGVEKPLVVLDNFETIAGDEQTRCLEFLSKRATCPTLITTRQKIGSLRNITIPVMDSEEAEQFIQLLIAETSDPSAFAKVDLERVKQVSDRNPLVMQWVVAQIDLAQKPDAVLGELTHGAGDAAQRVFERSFELEHLGDDGRAALLALSLFAPDTSRAALAEVAGFDDDSKRLNQAIKSLAGMSLVKIVSGGSRLSVEGLTRALSKARLTRHRQADDFRRRFVDYFRNYAQSHSEPTPEDYDELEAEKDNLVIAADAALTLKDWESAWRIVDIIANPATGVLVIHGYWDEAARLNDQMLAASYARASESDVAVFAHNVAMMREKQGDLDEARRLYNESLEIEKRLGNQHGIAVTLHNLGLISQIGGHLDEARRLYNESLEIEKKLGNVRGIAVTLHQLGLIAQEQGELEEARRLYLESLAIKERIADRSGIGITLHQLGTLAERSGELTDARRFFEQSLSLAKTIGDQHSIASTLHNLAALAQRQDDLKEAAQLYEESLSIKRRLRDLRGIAGTLHNLAILARDQGDSERARRLYEESLEIGRRIGDRRIVQSALASLVAVVQEGLELDHEKAEQLMREGRWREARTILERNKEEFRNLQDRNGFARTLLALAQTEQAIGDLERARWTYKDALNQFRELDERYAAITSVYLGRLELQTGLVKDALAHLKDAETFFVDSDGEPNLAIVRQLLKAAEQLVSKQTDDEDWFNRTKPEKNS